MKAHVELRPDPAKSRLGYTRWLVLVNGRDISAAVAHDGFHLDFDHGMPRLVLTLLATADIDLDMPEAEVEIKREPR